MMLSAIKVAANSLDNVTYESHSEMEKYEAEKLNPIRAN